MADYRGKQGGSTSVDHPRPVTEIGHRFNKRGRDIRRVVPQKHSCLQTTQNLTLQQSAAAILMSNKYNRAGRTQFSGFALFSIQS
jgi:hypothetical protein